MEREKIEQSVAVINAVYGAPARLAELASDILQHWDARSAAMHPFIESPGKAMIVCSTRDICADLYGQIIKLRPDWHDDAVDAGVRSRVLTNLTTAVAPETAALAREELTDKHVELV